MALKILRLLLGVYFATTSSYLITTGFLQALQGRSPITTTDTDLTDVGMTEAERDHYYREFPVEKDEGRMDVVVYEEPIGVARSTIQRKR